jgi:hypothetical protein
VATQREDDPKGFDWLMLWTALGAVTSVVVAIVTVYPAFGIDFRAISPMALTWIGTVVLAASGGVVTTTAIIVVQPSYAGRRRRVGRIGIICLVSGAIFLSLGFAKTWATGTDRATAGPANPPPISSPTSATTPAVTPSASDSASSCASAMFAGIPANHKTAVEVAAVLAQRLGPSVPNPVEVSGDYGATIVSGTATVAYLRLKIDYPAGQFTVDSVADTSCKPILIHGQPQTTLGLGATVDLAVGSRLLAVTVSCCEASYALYAYVK